MQTRRSRIFVVLTLISAGIVAGAAIAQAIREHSWQPIWSVGWLPAVLVVALRGPRSQQDCWRRVGRRTGTHS